jgi:hypothetical protein
MLVYSDTLRCLCAQTHLRRHRIDSHALTISNKNRVQQASATTGTMSALSHKSASCSVLFTSSLSIAHDSSTRLQPSPVTSNYRRHEVPPITPDYRLVREPDMQSPVAGRASLAHQQRKVVSEGYIEGRETNQTQHVHVLIGVGVPRNAHRTQLITQG